MSTKDAHPVVSSNEASERLRGVEELRDSATHMGQGLKEMGTAVRHVAQDGMQSAKDSAGKLYQSGRDGLSRLQEGVGCYVKERPGQSLLLALGAGVLLGFLLRRKR